MMRSIQISTEVFSAIWAARQLGEETEDDILRRVLTGKNVAGRTALESSGTSSTGFTDDRNGVTFPAGFEIFRHYKRKEYRAIAGNGAWTRVDTGQKFSSLNQLNTSIAAGTENVWNGNWKFRSADGSIHSIAELRSS